MTGPLDGVEAKLQRAKEHMHTCWDAYHAALSANAVTLRLEPDPEAGYYVGKVESVPTLPPSIGVLVGDVVHEFRSALDHLAWQAALRQTDKPHRRTSFPITDSEKDYGLACAYISNLGPEESAIVERFQPYNRGGEYSPLRMLRVLSNKDKHKVLNAVVVRATIVGATFEGVNCTVEGTEWIRDGRELEVDAQFVRLKLGGNFTHPEVKMKGNFVPEVALEGGDTASRTFIGIGSEVAIIATEFEFVLEPRPPMTKGRRWPSFSAWPDPSWWKL